MPVEIKELVIKAVIDGGNNKPLKDESISSNDSDQEAIVDACVKQVLKILKQAKER